MGDRKDLLTDGKQWLDYAGRMNLQKELDFIGTIVPSAPNLLFRAGEQSNNTTGIYRMIKSIMLLLLVCMIIGLSPKPGIAQTPSVSIVNTTRGGSTVFYVGDTWTVSITGGAANSQVEVNGYAEGYTDASGGFSLNGYMASNDVGTWNETWTVAGVAATPNPLTFTVYPASAATCDLKTSGSTSILSIDYLDPISYAIDYQALGYVYLDGVLDNTGFCVMYSDYWDFGPSMGGTRLIFQPYLDQWEIFDNGYRPGYVSGYTDPSEYYPYVDVSGLGFVAINVTNGEFWYDWNLVGLTVEYTVY